MTARPPAVSELPLEQRSFARAASAFADAVARIEGDAWDLEVPDALRWRDAIRTVRDLIGHHAYDDAWVPDVLAGRTLAEVGAAHDGDLLGDDPAASAARLATAAALAVSEVDDLSRVVHVSYGELETRDYLLHTTIFRGLGACDVSGLIGVAWEPPDELVHDLLDLIAPHAEALRAMGVFGPALALPAGAPAQARLLALTGRDPSR